MKLFVVFVVLFIISSGCGKMDAPRGVINADVMPLILSEMFKADGVVAFMQQGDTCICKSKIFDSIYLKYNTDSVAFQRSIEYYSKDSNKYTQIYDSAYNIIKKEQESLTIIINNK